MYYNTKRGSLPQGAKPVFKAGLNRWESIQLADMQRAEAAPAGDSEWWSVDITIPKVIHASLSATSSVLTAVSTPTTRSVDARSGFLGGALNLNV